MAIRLKTVVALLAAVTALTSAALALGAEDSVSVPPAESAPAEGAPAETQNAPFVLREFEGRVAVFSPGRDMPLSVTGIELSTLRKQDRELLFEGLAAGNREELLMLLEDLGS